MTFKGRFLCSFHCFNCALPPSRVSPFPLIEGKRPDIEKGQSRLDSPDKPDPAGTTGPFFPTARYYSFGYGFIRDVVYQIMLFKQRTMLHRLVCCSLFCFVFMQWWGGVCSSIGCQIHPRQRRTPSCAVDSWYEIAPILAGFSLIRS